MFKAIGVPLAIVFLIYQARSQFGAAPLQVDWLLLVCAVLVNQLALIAFAVRMRRTLRLATISLDLVQSIRIHLQSMLYFFILPMTIGMEAARMWLIRVIHPGAPVVSIGLVLAMDRVLGAASAMVVALVSLLFVGSLNLPNLDWDWAGLAVIVVGISTIAVVALLPRFRASVSASIRALLDQPRAVARAFYIAIVTQLLFVCAVWLSAHALGIPVSFGEIAFGISVAMLFVVIPLSFGGAGPVEVAVAMVFIALGQTHIDSVMLATILYFLRLIAALQGGIWQTIEGWRDFPRR